MNKQVWSTRLSVFAMVVAFSGLSIVPADVEAKRMGGGGSMGRSAPSQFQKSPPSAPASTPQRAAPNQQANTPNSAAAGSAAAAPRNRFLGPLGGLAAGLGLAALFSHLGLGAGMAEALGTMLMIGLAVVAALFLFRMLRSKSNSQRPAYSGAGTAGTGKIGSINTSGNNTYRQASQGSFEPVPGMGAPASSSPAPSQQGFQGFGQFGNPDAFEAPVQNDDAPVKQLPAGFDEAGFVNSAKKFFVTMQGVYDKGDVQGLREYCSDEVVDHLRREIEARGNAVNRTDVVTLDAELVGFETDVDEQVATVAFTGMMREEQDAVATEIRELWIMTRPVSGGGWVLSGIHNL